jgi:pantoate--beta-alanine ligase
MRILYSIKEMQKFSKNAHLKNKTIGFVPTMGALHEGHLSLMRWARKENDCLIVSIFVNPLQFGPKEDFRRYPRDLKRDTQLCKQEGVDIIFYPKNQEMYPPGFKTYIDVEDLSSVLCAKFRPGHFRGVAAIVAKLFNIVCPDIAYFGQKDAQQAIIIKKMAQDLNIPAKIKIMPTVREKDGLAMSSRNVYLNKLERKEAVVLYRALDLARRMFKKGNRGSSLIIRKMKKLIEEKKTTKVQYIAIVDLENLKPVNTIKNKTLITMAVWFGRTRLIDNIILN